MRPEYLFQKNSLSEEMERSLDLLVDAVHSKSFVEFEYVDKKGTKTNRLVIPTALGEKKQGIICCWGAANLGAAQEFLVRSMRNCRVATVLLESTLPTLHAVRDKWHCVWMDVTDTEEEAAKRTIDLLKLDRGRFAMPPEHYCDPEGVKTEIRLLDEAISEVTRRTVLVESKPNDSDK